MWPLESVASTPEGARLGALAARSVTVQFTPLPWWEFPWEPLRWFYAVTGIAPHSIFVAAGYALACALLAVRLRRRGWLAACVVAEAAFLMLMGGYQANGYIQTRVPYGETLIVPPGVPFRLANLHAHSQASGGVLMPEDVVRWHVAHGYSVMALTDSNKVYGAERARQEAARLGLPIVVLKAEEYRGSTHLLMLNLQTAVRADQVPIAEAIRQARAQGATVIAAHPWTSPLTPQQLVALGVQGFEVCTEWTESAPEVLQTCQEGGLAALGSLDFRQGNSSHTATVLPLDADTPEKVQRALEEGRCATLLCPDLVHNAGTGFRYFSRLYASLPRIAAESGFLLFPGLAFYALVGRAFIRLPGLRSPRPAGLLGAVFLLSNFSGLLAAWSVWWAFKAAWFPTIELSLASWCVTTPLCAYLLREYGKGGKTPLMLPPGDGDQNTSGKGGKTPRKLPPGDGDQNTDARA